MKIEKNCTKCGELKNLESYYTDKRSSDGRASQCSSCSNKYSRKKRSENGEAVRAYYREQRTTITGLESLRKYATSQKGKEVAKKSQKKWGLKNQHKKYTHGAVSHGIASGKIKKMPCEICGTTEKIHAHHEDYSKVLDVVWLCCTHHNERHRDILKEKKT